MRPRTMRQIAASTALATILVAAAGRAAADEGGPIRIIGTPVGNSGWPSHADGPPRTDLIEAGREPSSPVRARPLDDARSGSQDPKVRAAMQELGAMLRRAHAAQQRDETSAPADFTFRATVAREGEGGEGRLRPEDLLFDPPSVLRTNPSLQASGLPDPTVPVPVASPRRPARAVPLPPVRPVPRAASVVPLPRPAPTPATATTDRPADRRALADPFAAWPIPGQELPGTADTTRGGPGGAPGAAGLPVERLSAQRRLATAAPILPLWTASDDGGDESPEVAGEAGDDEPLPTGPAPYRLVRMLTALQDDIARGAGAALAAQRVLTDRIAERFAASQPREWTDPRNARALVIHALSGGSPPVLRDVLRRAALEAPFDALAAGALAYLEGRADDARRHFGAVTDEELDDSVRGPVYLARAALAVETDPATALDLLERARLSAPATLVEEAALRRALLVAAETDDVATFEKVAERYLRKFRRSLYAGNFRQRLAAAVTRMSFIREPAAFARLEALLEPMTDAGRQELFLHLARAAIENGNHLAAEIAAERARQTAVPDSLDARRAALYEAAADVVDPEEFEAAVAALERLREAELPDDDRALLFAALNLSQTVTDLAPAAHAPQARRDDAPPDTAPEDGDARPGYGEDGSPPAGPENFDVAAVERRVDDALARIDQLLEETP